MPTLTAILYFAVSTFAGFAELTNSTTRPSNWAIKLERPGLPSLFQVTTNLYRGAQLTAAGLRELKATGVKTILNLRTFHSDARKISGTELAGKQVRMEPWRVDAGEVVRFLKIMANTNRLPVFVHCERGADRTGTICAMYRIVCCGWTKQEAIRELKKGGFGFNPAWQNLINYIENADIEKLRGEAGIRK